MRKLYSSDKFKTCNNVLVSWLTHCMHKASFQQLLHEAMSGALPMVSAPCSYYPQSSPSNSKPSPSNSKLSPSASKPSASNSKPSPSYCKSSPTIGRAIATTACRYLLPCFGASVCLTQILLPVYAYCLHLLNLTKTHSPAFEDCRRTPWPAELALLSKALS